MKLQKLKKARKDYKRALEVCKDIANRYNTETTLEDSTGKVAYNLAHEYHESLASLKVAKGIYDMVVEEFLANLLDGDE